MTALEEIKKALEGATLYPGPWEVGELIKRRPYSDAWELQNATDLFGYIYCGHEAPEDVKPVVEYIAAVNPVAITELVSTLESLQRENDEMREVERSFAGALNAHTLRSVDLERRAEAAEAEVKRLRDRYERWMPVSDVPPAGMHPDALLHFYCISDEVESDESPEYWKTDTWQDKPDDAVYWCAIVSPLGPHERTFIARTALASTGGEHHGN